MLQESKTNELEYQRLSKDEMEQRGILGRLVGICADFISPTRNGRKYPEKLWENVFNDPIMKERIENGVCYGELGHPTDREETDMEKIAVCLAEQPKKGKDGKLRAVFDIVDTPNGRILKSLCDYGSTLGISSRGSGDLETDFDGQESVNPDTYTCEGFDVVLIPAVKEARLQYVTEALDKKRYNKTLREKLTESINKETIENKKVINESLNTLGINLSENADENLNIYCVEFLYDTYDDLTDVSDTNLRGYINVEANSPEQALDAAENYYTNRVDSDYRYNFRHFTISSNKAINVDTINANKILRSNSLTEGQIGDLVSQTTASGTLVRDSKGKIVGEFPTDDEATEFMREQEKEPEIFTYSVDYVDANDIVDSITIQAESPSQARKLAKNKLGKNCRPIDAKLIDESLNSTKLNEEIYLSKDWHKLKVGDMVKQKTVSFDGIQVWNCVVKEVYPDHIIMSPTEENFTDINFWVDDDVVDKVVDLDEELSESDIDATVADIEKSAEEFTKALSSAAGSDGALIEELQSLLSTNKQLQDKIIDLQEKLSVSYAKEVSLKEELDKYKANSIKLSRKVVENKSLNEQLNVVKDNVEHLDKRCNKLKESINKKNLKIQQLVETISNKDEKLNQLTEQINNSNKELKEKENTINTVTEKYETLNTNYKQMKESYSKKMDTQNNLVEKYRGIAVKSVNKYIDTQAIRLGVKPAEIKNRLPESYSFQDIDRICEDLQEYKLNMSNLPFANNKRLDEGLRFTANNVDTRTLVPMEEELDELTLRLAGLK